LAGVANGQAGIGPVFDPAGRSAAGSFGAFLNHAGQDIRHPFCRLGSVAALAVTAETAAASNSSMQFTHHAGFQLPPATCRRH